MKWLISHKSSGMVIRTFLMSEGRFSKRLLIKAKSPNGNILVNGEKKTVRYVLQADDVLEVILPPERPNSNILCEAIPLNIVYEDHDILVINKPAGVATIPSRQHTSGTIANGLLYYYQEKEIEATVHIVTRLDKDTSGLMLIAKSQHCHSLFSKIQEKNEMNRIYTAIVEGTLEMEKGTINQPIGRKEKSIIERNVTKEGKKAITHYTILEKLNEATLVKIVLETGRTHQIRVHFSSIGHPVTGDELYGGNINNFDRQALHCSEISFIHPFSGKKMHLKVPLPKDIKQLQERLRNV